MGTTFIIDIEIYDSEIHVLSGVSDDEFDNYVMEKFNQEIKRTTSTAAFWTIFDKEGRAIYLIDFKKKLKKDYYSINTIAHESMHAVNAILIRNSIKYVHDVTDEAYCCLNGFITGKIYQGVFHA